MLTCDPRELFGSQIEENPPKRLPREEILERAALIGITPDLLRVLEVGWGGKGFKKHMTRYFGVRDELNTAIESGDGQLFEKAVESWDHFHHRTVQSRKFPVSLQQEIKAQLLFRPLFAKAIETIVDRSLSLGDRIASYNLIRDFFFRQDSSDQQAYIHPLETMALILTFGKEGENLSPMRAQIESLWQFSVTGEVSSEEVFQIDDFLSQITADISPKRIFDSIRHPSQSLNQARLKLTGLYRIESLLYEGLQRKALQEAVALASRHQDRLLAGERVDFQIENLPDIGKLSKAISHLEKFIQGIEKAQGIVSKGRRRVSQTAQTIQEKNQQLASSINGIVNRIEVPLGQLTLSPAAERIIAAAAITVFVLGYLGLAHPNYMAAEGPEPPQAVCALEQGPAQSVGYLPHLIIAGPGGGIQDDIETLTQIMYGLAHDATGLPAENPGAITVAAYGGSFPAIPEQTIVHTETSLNPQQTTADMISSLIAQTDEDVANIAFIGHGNNRHGNFVFQLPDGTDNPDNTEFTSREIAKAIALGVQRRLQRNPFLPPLKIYVTLESCKSGSSVIGTPSAERQSPIYYMPHSTTLHQDIMEELVALGVATAEDEPPFVLEMHTAGHPSYFAPSGCPAAFLCHIQDEMQHGSAFETASYTYSISYLRVGNFRPIVPGKDLLSDPGTGHLFDDATNFAGYAKLNEFEIASGSVSVQTEISNFSTSTYTYTLSLVDSSPNLLQASSEDVVISPLTKIPITATFTITETGVITGSLEFRSQDPDHPATLPLYFDPREYPPVKFTIGDIGQDIENGKITIPLDIKCPGFTEPMNLTALFAFADDTYYTREITVTDPSQATELSFTWSELGLTGFRGNLSVFSPKGELIFYQYIDTTDHNDTYDQARENGPIASGSLIQGELPGFDRDLFLIDPSQDQMISVTNTSAQGTDRYIAVNYGPPEEYNWIYLEPGKTAIFLHPPTTGEYFVWIGPVMLYEDFDTTYKLKVSKVASRTFLPMIAK